MRKSALLASAVLACGLGQAACTTNQDAQRQSERMTMAEGADGDWTVYGGDLSNTRYVANDQINAGNVKGLHLKWIFQTGVLGSFQTTPIVEDGVMYITTPYNHVFAVDARTGRELWHYEHKLGTTIFCCGPNNRGVALADDKVYMATLDAMLIALDKTTGALVWETQIADPEFGYSETAAPTVYQDKIILGISGAEYGIRGFISAYNKDTGELVWRWHTIPAPDEVQPDGTTGWYGNFNNMADGMNPLNRNIAAEKAAIQSGQRADAWQRGGGSNWMTNAIDPERGMVPGVIHGGKTGWVYVHNAETGELLRRSENMIPHENLFTPPTEEGIRMLPGANGGVEWSPGAFNPDTRMAYYVNLHQPMTYTVKKEPWEQGKLWLGGAFTAIPGEDQWGNVTAVNVDTAEIVWQARTEDRGDVAP